MPPYNRRFIEGRASTIDRCAERCRETVVRSEDEYPDRHDRADVLLVNLIRLSEACIDIAKHLTKALNLGLVRDSRSAFRLVFEVLDMSLDDADELSKMVGFRNLAVHDYTKVERRVVEDIVARHLELPIRFASQARGFAERNSAL